MSSLFRDFFSPGILSGQQNPNKPPTVDGRKKLNQVVVKAKHTFPGLDLQHAKIVGQPDIS